MSAGADGPRVRREHPGRPSVSDSSGKRAAAAAVVLVTAWIATYWLWEPSEGHGDAGVVFDDAPPAAGVEVADPEPADLPIADPLADARRSFAEPEEVDEGAPLTPTRRLVPPEFDVYVVRRGDQMMTIAKELYGDTRYWQSIAKANPNVDPQGGLRVGQELLVPKDPGNIQGVVVDDAGQAQTPPARAPERIEHVVQPNDSLWKIAASFYGDGTKWTIIRDANRDLVGAEGERLRPGMTLVIPAAPKGAQ